jgi:hypothetical protein
MMEVGKISFFEGSKGQRFKATKVKRRGAQQTLCKKNFATLRLSAIKKQTKEKKTLCLSALVAKKQKQYKYKDSKRENL